ncbi:MAG: ERAP1-like C-terminal domain-containing protein [Alphaproteobacteria bacterium]|nr:ERAP1-like C-terminal domain-containing protein [Alphaproteobacteria bacterium]
MLTKTFRSWLFAGIAGTLVLSGCTRGGDDVTFDQVPPILQDVPPAGQLPEGVTPTAYRLDLFTDPAQDEFSGTVEIDISLDEPHARIWLHSVDHDVSSAFVVLADGTRLDAEFTRSKADGGVSRLDFETPVPQGNSTLTMTYAAPYNFNLSGLYKAEQNGRPYLATQMEPIDARRLVPSFDEPRFKTPWTLTVATPAGNQVVTNGALKAQTVRDDGNIEFQFATTREIQSYLVALAVGPYDLRDGGVLPPNGIRPRAVPFRGFSPSGKGDKLENAMAITDEMVTWQEAYFDYPYPYGKLDLIAVPDFAYGAMENAGAIIYRESALLMDERTSLARRRGAMTTHAHELGHQWFGNLVTPRWWNDIWLNEAFATWISYKTMDTVYPDTGFDLAAQRAAIGAMDNDSLASARQIRSPIARNADILDAFDSITFRKGGGVLSMFENYLGEEAFRDGIRLHMRRFEDGVADVDDFITSIADGSKTPDVVESFTSFIMQPGIPHLDVEFTCPAPDAGLIRVSQSRYAPVGSTIDPTAQTWVIPLAIKMNGANGERTVRQIFSGSSMDVPLDGGCPDWVLPNADGAGYWRFALNESAWQNLITNHDQLSAAEQLSFIDSATAAFTSGDLSASTLLQAIAVNANGSWSAALDPLSTLNSYLDVLPDEVSKDAFRDFVRAAYDERWNRLASSPTSSLSEGEQLLKTSLSSALINMDRLDEERARLAAGAAAYVGVINSPDPSTLTPDLVQTAIRIAAENDDGAFFQAALDYAESATNQRERRQIFYTLARKSNEADALALMDLVLTDAYEGQLTWGVYLATLQNEAARAATWEKFKTDFEQVIAKSPEIRKPQTARLVSYFCTSDEIDDAIAFVETQASLISGYERRLAQATESARLCAAFRAEKGTELAAALEAQ